jgi:hypothetical protein
MVVQNPPNFRFVVEEAAAGMAAAAAVALHCSAARQPRVAGIMHSNLHIVFLL